MGLKDIARQLNENTDLEGAAAAVVPPQFVEDAFDAPMVIMNQIHEA